MPSSQLWQATTATSAPVARMASALALAVARRFYLYSLMSPCPPPEPQQYVWLPFGCISRKSAAT